MKIESPPKITADKQLVGIDVSVALFKWKNSVACNLKEVAVATGYDYKHVRNWGLPLFDGKITRSEFEAWKRQRKQKKKNGNSPNEQSEPRKDRKPGLATAARQRRLVSDRCDLSRRPRGSRGGARSQPVLAGTA